jgi:uncharacterized protein (DUF486 family)
LRVAAGESGKVRKAKEKDFHAKTPSSQSQAHDIFEKVMTTVILLIISNAFMTFAWYGHLKHRSMPILSAIVVSWLIAFGEYCFQVPANRIGYGYFTAYQLKVIQECITWVVFAVFAYFYLGEPVRWNYAASFLCILGAVGFAFWGKL